ncbi:MULTISPECIES: AAA family ATPase [Pontibacillus]|uniref:AAA family ATPase n=1 Tax=Pontibacillus chungwhensis TaxID=265426 RepID=A0ABY8V4E6_9BACI|nr:MULTISPECIES: AAA family ATPase [Pontibacillus]MCD5322182.1 ATP-binding protein [Pontibacillus sp. HN14]WIF99475.1 AAA family ATPase [Pontibacillus chungwhensis]
MKRLAILTVGKTHSGKSTFARALERELDHSFVMDQDNHAEFINAYYQKLQPEDGPNTLKHSISKLIVNYAKEHTNLHIIASSANRTKAGRQELLKNIYPPDEFVRIVVHFDLQDDLLRARVKRSERKTTIFRGDYSNFDEILERQQAESSYEGVTDPKEGEADHLFVIQDPDEVEGVMESIVELSNRL